MQLSMAVVPDPDDLELWLKVLVAFYSYKSSISSLTTSLLVTPHCWVEMVLLPLQVDGEVRQKGSTKDMIFKIPFLISHISSIMTLLEGDVILTGTLLHLTLSSYSSSSSLASILDSPKFFLHANKSCSCRHSQRRWSGKSRPKDNRRDNKPCGCSIQCWKTKGARKFLSYLN